MQLTDAVFQAPRFWLNAAARSNIMRMSTVEATFHLEIFAPVSADAKENMLRMSVTEATFQLPKSSGPKTRAEASMNAMLDTLAVHQPPIFWLNDLASLNM